LQIQYKLATRLNSTAATSDVCIGHYGRPYYCYYYYYYYLGHMTVIIRVAPNFGFGFGQAEIRPFFPNSAKFGFGQIFGRILPNLADANATAVRSVSYLTTGKN